MLNKTFIDENGLVKPRRSWTNSGNGMRYTVEWNLLNAAAAVIPVAQLYDEKLGVLKRTPDNKFGQESVDNWLSFAVWLLIIRDKTLARKVLKSAALKFGFMQNDFTEKGAFLKSQMFRFPLVWIFVSAAAFDCLRFPARLLLSLIEKFSPYPPFYDPTAIGLNFLWLCGLFELGAKTPLKKFIVEFYPLDLQMSPQYDEGHPNLLGFRSFSGEVLK